MIKIVDLVGKQNGQPVFRIGNLTVQPGSKTALVAGNGWGKTTLLRILDGLHSDYTGTADVAVGRKKRTLVHQHAIQFSGTVRENLLFGLRVRGIAQQQRNERVRRIASQLLLTELLDRDAGTISGGEKKRSALARGLVIGPQLLLLDEPLADLDAASADALIECLEQQETMTVVVTLPEWDDRLRRFSRVDLR